MGMFTKLFKKDVDPYTLPGRWYKFDFSVTDSSVSSDIKDLEFVSKASTTFVFRTSKKVVDMFICDVTYASTQTPTNNMIIGRGTVRFRADGDYTVSINSAIGSFRGFILCLD